MYPSILMLGWMSLTCCILPSHGRVESTSVLLSVLVTGIAMMSQAGAMESGQTFKGRKDVFLQLAAVVVFFGRAALFAASLL